VGAIVGVPRRFPQKVSFLQVALYAFAMCTPGAMGPVRAIFPRRKMAFLTVLVGGLDSSQSQERTA